MIFDDAVVFIKHYWKQALPSWDDVIDDLDYNVQHNKPVKFLDRFGFVTHFGERIKKVSNVVDHIHSLRPKEVKPSAHLYISMLTTSGTFGRHNDTSDVFYIQGLGSSRFDVEEGTDQSYVLEPGDLLYIPASIYHTPQPLSPRVGISIGFD